MPEGLVRATVLVGYGGFGLDVLQRLLVNAALRGALRWRDPQGGAGAGERHLEDLALVWIQDPGEQIRVRQDGSAEVLRDLYREIEEVPESSRLEAEVTAAIETKARQVLSASSRATGSRAAKPLGLDIILIAHPAAPESIGTLDRLMTAAMDHLANYPNLTAEVQGSGDPLAFVEILDFDNYWDRADAARRLRQAVRRSVDGWQNRRQGRRPAFGRIYLTDGASTHEGLRAREHRLDEISLFLELLLFEQPREADDRFRRLARSSGAHESVVGAFGVRLLERSAGLLSRLAAARFGIGWLDYLATGSQTEASASPQHLNQKLEPYRAERLERLMEAGNLDEELIQSLRTLEQELLAVPPEEADWLERVKIAYRRKAALLQERLAGMTAERMAAIGRDHLAKLPADLRAGIDADLRDATQPTPLATVLAEIDRASAELGELSEPETDTQGEGQDPFAGLARLHHRYRDFHDDQLDLGGLNAQWWPLFSLALTVAATPKTIEIAADHWPGLPLLANPLLTAPLLFLLAWGFCALVLQRLFTARSRRARHFFTDADRGRFADRLRDDMGPGGPLRRPIETVLEGLLNDMRWGVRSEVRRELQLFRERLAERRREMGWLRNELREFLKLHGVSLEGGTQHLHRVGRPHTGIRQSIEKREDFERILAKNPTEPSRYRSLQSDVEHNPFAEWHVRHASSFLYPLAFIDRLSRAYSDPFADEQARPGTGPEQAARAQEVIDFFDRYGSFDLSFGWKKQEGVPSPQRFGLLPSSWRRLPAVLPRLSELGMVEENVYTGADEARAYLVRVELGVASEALEESR